MSHRYCGRDFHADDIAAIRQLIAEDPARTRAELSRLTCRALHWHKPDGGLKDMSARVAMLRMHADGLIVLPPPRGTRPDASVRISTLSDPGAPIDTPASALAPLALRRVRTKADSRLYNEYIERYHYLGHKPLPGAQLRYIVYSAEQPIALLGFGAAAWTSAPRDHYIGWSHEQRQRNLHLVVNWRSALSWVSVMEIACLAKGSAAAGVRGRDEARIDSASTRLDYSDYCMTRCNC